MLEIWQGTTESGVGVKGALGTTLQGAVWASHEEETDHEKDAHFLSARAL